MQSLEKHAGNYRSTAQGWISLKHCEPKLILETIGGKGTTINWICSSQHALQGTALGE